MVSPKNISDSLARYPSLRLFAAKVYGLRKFNPGAHQYQFRNDVETTSNLEGRTYEIIFDAQPLQTSTRLRGIGRYAINFMVSYCNSMPDSRFLALFTNVAEVSELEMAIKELRNTAPENLEIQVIDVFQGSSQLGLQTAQQNLANIITSADTKKVLIFDGFEKLNNRIPISKSSGYKRIEILHDLIKQKFPESLLPSNYDKSLYSYLLQDASKVDLVLSNSKTTSNDWLTTTGQDSPVIFGASAFSVKEIGNPLSTRSGLLIVGAEQPHKNVERAISAYSKLPERLRNQNPLTLVGIRAKGFREYLSQRFKGLLPAIVFTTNISDQTLKEYYRSNRLVVMPSLAEGLGLPLLEAWNFGTVAVGSSGTVAEETLQNPDLMFNPLDTHSITKCMEQYLSSDEAWILAQHHLLESREDFSWVKSVNLAQKAIKGLNE